MSPSTRLYREEDLPRVNAIEGTSFPNPWPTSFFQYNHRKAPDPFVVAEDGDEIVGYVIGELREIMFSGVSHMSKVGHILNIAVEKAHRKGGVGTLLMREIERRFGEANATRVTLEVRESNATAQSFYRGLGFNELGRVRAYYPDEDAIVMSKTL